MPKLTNKMRFPTTCDMAELEETLRFVQWRKATGYDMHDTILHLLGIDHENLTFRTSGNEEQVRMVLRQLDALYRSAALRPRELGIARTVAEAEKINAQGRLALFLHLTGAWIADDLVPTDPTRELGSFAFRPSG